MPLTTIGLKEVTNHKTSVGKPVLKASALVDYANVEVTINGVAGVGGSVTYEDCFADFSSKKHLVTQVGSPTISPYSGAGSVGVNALALTAGVRLDVTGIQVLTDCTISMMFEPAAGTGSQVIIEGLTDDDLNASYDASAGRIDKIFNTTVSGSSMTMNTGQLYHVVLMRKGTTGYVLIDGALVWTGVVTNAGALTTDISLYGSSTGDSLGGKVQEFVIMSDAIYNIAPSFLNQTYFEKQSHATGSRPATNPRYRNCVLILSHHLPKGFILEDTSAGAAEESANRNYVATFKDGANATLGTATRKVVKGSGGGGTVSNLGCMYNTLAGRATVGFGPTRKLTYVFNNDSPATARALRHVVTLSEEATGNVTILADGVSLGTATKVSVGSTAPFVYEFTEAPYVPAVEWQNENYDVVYTVSGNTAGGAISVDPITVNKRAFGF